MLLKIKEKWMLSIHWESLDSMVTTEVSFTATACNACGFCSVMLILNTKFGKVFFFSVPIFFCSRHRHTHTHSQKRRTASHAEQVMLLFSVFTINYALNLAIVCMYKHIRTDCARTQFIFFDSNKQKIFARYLPVPWPDTLLVFMPLPLSISTISQRNADISCFISLTSSSVTPCDSAFRCSTVT